MGPSAGRRCRPRGAVDPGWRRRRRLRQIGDQLPGLKQFLLVDDVVAVADGAARVPGEEHGDALGNAGADQGAGGGAATIVEEAGRHAGRLTGCAPARARSWPPRPAPSARVPRSRPGSYLLTWMRPAAHRRAVSGPCRPPGLRLRTAGAGGRVALTRWCVARGGGAARCA